MMSYERWELDLPHLFWIKVECDSNHNFFESNHEVHMTRIMTFFPSLQTLIKVDYFLFELLLYDLIKTHCLRSLSRVASCDSGLPLAKNLHTFILFLIEWKCVTHERRSQKKCEISHLLNDCYVFLVKNKKPR